MTDSIVTPKNTKLIAEWMGKRIEYVKHNLVFIIDSANIPCSYRPITDADRCFELLEKLLNLRWKTEMFSRGIFILVNKDTGIAVKAATLTLVIYKAALYEAKK